MGGYGLETVCMIRNNANIVTNVFYDSILTIQKRKSIWMVYF